MKMPKYILRAQELLLEAKDAQDYLNILHLLDVGARLKNGVVEHEKARARISGVIDELKLIEQDVVYCMVCDRQVTGLTGGFHDKCGGPTEQVWPPNEELY